VVDVAFNGAPSTVHLRDRVRRRLMWLAEVHAHCMGEVYIDTVDGVDLVVHLGRRGNARAVRKLVLTAICLLGVVVVAEGAVIGLLTALFSVMGMPLLGAAIGCCVAMGVVVGLAVLSRPRIRMVGPGLWQKLDRRGVRRPYWLINTLAAVPRSTPRGLVATAHLKQALPQLLPIGATVVAVARSQQHHRAYRWLGFTPLGTSPWVLHADVRHLEDSPTDRVRDRI
jgi:hypothetical protein